MSGCAYEDRRCPIGTLTPDEQERARLAFEQTPSILDVAILAALGTVDHGDQVAQAILGRVRPCSAS